MRYLFSQRCFHVDILKGFGRNTLNEKQAQRKSIKNKVLSDSFPRRKTWEKLELFSTHQVLTKLSENFLRLLKTVFSKKPIQIQNLKKSPSAYRDAGCTYISSRLDHSNGSLNTSIFLGFSSQISMKALSLSSSVPYCVLSGRLDANMIKGS